MRKSILFIMLSLFAIQMASAKDIVTRDVEKLPTDAKTFLTKYFPNDKVSYIKIDEELLTTTYEVVFTSGTEVEFSDTGMWIEIDCKRAEVPAGSIPEKIVSYVKQNFPEAFITKIEKKRYKYEVDLSNKLELDFDRDGNFTRMDD